MCLATRVVDTNRIDLLPNERNFRGAILIPCAFVDLLVHVIQIDTTLR